MDSSDFERSDGQRTHCDVRNEDQPANPKFPGAESTPLGYRPRKAHKKSKSGCTICKTRRIKCDETKPSCDRCRIRGVQCIYSSPNVSQNQQLELRARNVSPTSDAFSMSLASTAEDITSLLQSAAGPGTTLTYATAGSTLSRENLQAMARFELFTSNTLGAPIVRLLVRNDVLRLGFKSPYLMHTIIATSITHLQRLVPTYTPQTFSAAYHWHQAITLSQQELNSTGPHGKDDIDALISTFMLLPIHHYTLHDQNPQGSWVFASDSNSKPYDDFAVWLFNRGGLKQVLDKFNGYPENSIWLPAVRDSDDHLGTFSDVTPGTRGIPAAFVELCGLDKTSTPDNNPFHRPLRMLSALLKIEISSAAFTKVVSFICVITGKFRELLLDRDPRALLILAYWHALMYRMDQWWVQDRTRYECQAVCMYLELHGDPRIVELLEFPALVCGYELSPGRIIIDESLIGSVLGTQLSDLGNV